MLKLAWENKMLITPKKAGTCGYRAARIVLELIPAAFSAALINTFLSKSLYFLDLVTGWSGNVGHKGHEPSHQPHAQGRGLFLQPLPLPATRMRERGGGWKMVVMLERGFYSVFTKDTMVHFSWKKTIL